MKSGSKSVTTFNPYVGNHLPPRRSTSTDREEIHGASERDRSLEIRWGDGHVSRHSYRWLRFNCFCLSCGSCNDGIRTIDLTLVPHNVRPSSLEQYGSDAVTIVWDDGHQSEYGGDWLRAHTNSSEERTRRRSWRPVTWKSRPIDDFPVGQFEDVASDDECRLEMFEGLRDHGLVRIDGVTTALESTERVAKLFGPLHETTLYGYITDVQSKPVSKLGGETAIHQHPHCDDVFHYTPPGIVIFHCIVNDTADGGISSYADGFAVAESIREEAPEAFRLLTTVPVQFIRRRPGHFDLRGEGRVIRLDDDGRIAGIRYFDRSVAPLDADEDLVDALLDAQTEFMRRIISPEFQVNHRLEPGAVVVVDNHRVLHGRTAFDPSAHRRLRTCVVDREEFHARWRELAYRLGRDDYDVFLSSGAV